MKKVSETAKQTKPAKQTKQTSRTRPSCRRAATGRSRRRQRSVPREAQAQRPREDEDEDEDDLIRLGDRVYVSQKGWGRQFVYEVESAPNQRSRGPSSSSNPSTTGSTLRRRSTSESCSRSAGGAERGYSGAGAGACEREQCSAFHRPACKARKSRVPIWRHLRRQRRKRRARQKGEGRARGRAGRALSHCASHVLI